VLVRRAGVRGIEDQVAVGDEDAVGKVGQQVTMTDDNDDDIKLPEGPDFESAEDVFGEELWTEVREICDRARRLLGAQVAGGFGAAEMQRVCLEVPKGLVLIAQYIVAREHFGQTWDWMEESLSDKGKEGRAVRQAVHERLTKYLTGALHEELHWLATGSHRILRAEAERRGWKREKS
jgi:hypothetical protein